MKVACILCHSIYKELLYKLEFGEIVKCSTCGLVYTLNTNGIDLVECDYGEQYYKNEGSQSRYGYQDYFGKEQEARIRVAQIFVQLLEIFGKSTGRLLDIGCGGGYFVHAATTAGWDAVGIDSSEYVVRMASKLVDGNVFYGSLRDYISSLGEALKFDAITMFDVIEHSRNPLREIELASSVLSTDGILVLITPIYGEKLSTEQGANYIQFKKDHIYHFSINTIGKLLRLTKFSDWGIYKLADILQDIKLTVPEDVLIKYQQEREHMLVICRR